MTTVPRKPDDKPMMSCGSGTPARSSGRQFGNNGGRDPGGWHRDQGRRRRRQRDGNQQDQQASPSSFRLHRAGGRALKFCSARIRWHPEARQGSRPTLMTAPPRPHKPAVRRASAFAPGRDSSFAIGIPLAMAPSKGHAPEMPARQSSSSCPLSGITDPGGASLASQQMRQLSRERNVVASAVPDHRPTPCRLSSRSHPRGR